MTRELPGAELRSAVQMMLPGKLHKNHLLLQTPVLSCANAALGNVSEAPCGYSFEAAPRDRAPANVKSSFSAVRSKAVRSPLAD